MVKKKPTRNGAGNPDFTYNDLNRAGIRFNNKNVIEIEYYSDSEDLTITKTDELTETVKTIVTNFDNPGGGAVLGTKTITENGTYTAADDELDGYSSVTVNVPGISLKDLAEKTQPSGVADLTGVKTAAYALNHFPNITRVYGTLAASSNLESAFADNTGMTTACIIAPSVSGGNRPFGSCNNLVTAALIVNETYAGLNYFNGCSNLETVDLLVYRLRTNSFASCNKLNNVILRNTSNLCALENNAIFSQTQFKSGGEGGTIYIPKVFYDHLGDNSAYDYKAATNWSVIDAYGTITWKQIEGSYYENHYADGTEITA